MKHPDYIVNLMLFNQLYKGKPPEKTEKELMEIKKFLEKKHCKEGVTQFLSVVREENIIKWPEELNFIFEKNVYEYVYILKDDYVDLIADDIKPEFPHYILKILTENAEETVRIKIDKEIKLTRKTVEILDLMTDDIILITVYGYNIKIKKFNAESD